MNDELEDTRADVEVDKDEARPLTDSDLAEIDIDISRLLEELDGTLLVARA